MPTSLMQQVNRAEDDLYSQIDTMPYVDFISFLKETNRCPGGKHTIRKILQNSFVNSQSAVLEIGSNTGFSSLEVARVAKCQVLGIDPVKSAVEESKMTLAQDTPEVRRLVQFEVGSAYDIPAKDEEYDLIISGGATSFMDDKQRAISEYKRVLKPWGFLSVAHFYYLRPPPADVLDNVSKIIGVNIQPWTKIYWDDLFRNNGSFETYWQQTSEVLVRSDEEIAAYVQLFLDKPHIIGLDPDIKEKIRNRWYTTLKAFNENHKYAGFQIVLFRKNILSEEPEIFPAKEA